MKTINCENCKSVMGLVKETPRWALYKCFSCRLVSGKINKNLTQDELKGATMEMDTYAESHIRYEFKDIEKKLESMSPQELDNFFASKDKLDDVVTKDEAPAKLRSEINDWLSALQC